MKVSPVLYIRRSGDICGKDFGTRKPRARACGRVRLAAAEVVE